MRDDRVAEAMQAVHPSGNPMSHSTHVGFREPLGSSRSTASQSVLSGLLPRAISVSDLAPPFQSRDAGVGHRRLAAASPFRGLVTSKLPRLRASFARGVGQTSARKSRGDRPPERIACAFVLLASGVGNKPEPVAPVMGANGGSGYAVPPRIIPERGQVSENDAKSSTKESCDVLHKHDAGSKLANEAGILAPQAGALTLNARASSGEGDVLAGEATTDGVHPKSICGQSLGGEGSHVVIAGHPWPVVGEEVSAGGRDLAERDRAEAGAL